MKFVIEVTMVSGSTYRSIELDDDNNNAYMILKSVKKIDTVGTLVLEQVNGSAIHLNGRHVESAVVTEIRE